MWRGRGAKVVRLNGLCVPSGAVSAVLVNSYPPGQCPLLYSIESIISEEGGGGGGGGPGWHGDLADSVLLLCGRDQADCAAVTRPFVRP